MTERRGATLHLVSDSTGETVAAAAEAALAQFPAPAPARREHVFVRTAEALSAALRAVAASPGPVFYTLVDPVLQTTLRARCAALGVPAVDLLAPVVATLSDYLGPPNAAAPGRQHSVDLGYFKRVEAIDFALAADDGAARAARYKMADVVLAGVSRTSKTPTCIYLAVKGLKAANAPLLPGRPLPTELQDAAEAGAPIVGLTISPNRLAQIRAQRLTALGADPDAAEYADLDAIRREVTEARLQLEALGAPLIDVTRRSIEETAAAVMALLRGETEAA